MSVLTPGAFPAHSAFPKWLESKEAKESVLRDVDSQLFSTRGTFTKAVGARRGLKTSTSQQVSQGSTVMEVRSLWSTICCFG